METIILNIFSGETIFGLDLFDKEDFIKLIIRFLFNFTVIIILIRLIYYPSAKRKDYLFTYFIVSSVVFLICFMLDNVKLELGLALGLFAIFGIIRYRTSQIPIKEMTYLFLVIGISVVNALANKKISYTEILLTNFFIILITYTLEKATRLRHVSRKRVIYEKIDLIKPEKRQELIADLEERTGLKIIRVEVGRIDFMRDIARLRIYYYEGEGVINLANGESF
ncbi:MAG: DUF4956 domain-containing protein [Bacteroidales bacterium]|nr:DUF4956 domain-containing protein [Bacteroidales bacterium]